MKQLHIGGVPEHFNLPWYLSLREKEFQKKGINLRWKNYPGGTGAMCTALRSGKVDMAVILTEGMIRDIIRGSESKIVQAFVKSPLLWGIHVAKQSEYKTVDDLKGTQAAISRYGSGSHLMAYVNAEKEGWDMEKELRFKVIENLEGALEMLPKGEGDYFMWEKFTTKPYVDNGPFRIVGECPTPWPCFVIAVRNEVLENNSEEIRTILEVINNKTRGFKQIPGIAALISERYSQQPEDVRQWLALTEWSQANLSGEQVSLIQQILVKVGLVKKTLPPEFFLHTL